jgi:hypothetical protein
MKFDCYFPMEIDDDELLDAVNDAFPPETNFESLKDVPTEAIKQVVWDEFLNNYVLFDLEKREIEIDNV